MEKLESYVAGLIPDAIEKLKALVTVNSFTSNPHGVNQVGRMTAEYFASLGFEAEFVESENPAFGRHLICHRPGTSGKMIGMVSHHDTVFSPAEEAQNDFSWRESKSEDGLTRYHGPGTVDIKGGTIMMHLVLSAIQEMRPDIFEATTWKLLINSSEETLSQDFGRLLKERLDPEQTKACLVFEGGVWEPETNNFPLVTSRKGMGQYRLTVAGRGAHAGTSHKNGANAITQMAEIVQAISNLTDYERDLTFNVGYMRGGLVMNRVAHEAIALVEFRAFDPAVHAEGLIAMRSLQGYSTVASESDGFACITNVEQLGSMAPWSINEGSEGLLKVWQAAAADFGFQVEARPRGGLSDGNHVWHHVPTIDALGPAGGWAHSSETSEDGTKEQEYVVRESFLPKAMLNAHAIINLLDQ